eukprot:TRINITY_DN5439_c0_g1_i1.p1 TRINITY_DN5439_c0_g1~~TRINITY_DN5439_c0_g1_i1.p1  ORF type:complete len:234 (+),score=60.36 TRINITY_DN5439_c0_g1_i1:1-702(+)
MRSNPTIFMSEGKTTLLTIDEVCVYFRIPPPIPNMGYRAGSWDRELVDWRGKLEVFSESSSEGLFVSLEKDGELLITVDGSKTEDIVKAFDSSRYYVFMITHPSGKKVPIGVAFYSQVESRDFEEAMFDKIHEHVKIQEFEDLKAKWKDQLTGMDELETFEEDFDDADFSFAPPPSTHHTETEDVFGDFSFDDVTFTEGNNTTNVQFGDFSEEVQFDFPEDAKFDNFAFPDND